MSSQIDGGYAWVVSLAAWTVTLIYAILDKGTGIRLPYFVDYFEQGAGVIGLAFAIIPALKHSLGFVAAILARKFGCRFLGIVGGLMVTTACFKMSVATSIFTVFLGCIFTAIGICFNYFVSYFVIDVYFKEKFTLAMVIKTTVNGIGIMVSPFINEVLISTYGWRSSFFILSALSFNLVVCGVIFRTPISKVNEPIGDTNETVEEEPLLLSNERFGNHAMNDNCRFVKYLYEILHVDLFENNALFAIFVATAFINGVMIEGVLLIMPDDMNNRGATLKSSQLIVTVYGASSIFGRQFPYFFTKLSEKDLFIQLTFTHLIQFLSLIVCVVYRSSYSIFITMILFGFSVGWMTLLIPLIVKSVTSDFFFGTSWVDSVYGFGVFIGMPILGYLRQKSGNYWLSECLLLILALIDAMLISSVVMYQRRGGVKK